MGEYADLAISETISSWDGRCDVRYGLSPVALKQPKTCSRCGKPCLYWAKNDGRWRLHHWALLPDEKAPRFVLHRCGFTSDGKPNTCSEGNTDASNT